MGCSLPVPEIIQELREAEENGQLNKHVEFLIDDEYKDDNKDKTDFLSKYNKKAFNDLLEIINFTEKLSTKLYGDLTKQKIIEIVTKEFKNSKKYSGSILLLTEDQKKLQVAGTSSENENFRKAEKITGYNIKKFNISLDKSEIYSKVIHKGKTVQFKINDLLEELFPKKLSLLIKKVINLDKNFHVATPLELNGEIIGAFGMSSTIYADFFIPTVKNLALHISHSFEHAQQNQLQKEANIKLHKSEEMYRNIVDSAPYGILIVDTKGMVTSVNSTSIKMSGYSEDELVGKNIANFPTMRKRDIPKYLKIFYSSIKGKVSEPFEINWIHKNGNIYTGETYISLIKQNNKVIGVQGIINDTTQRKITIRRLKDAEERYNSLFDGSLDCVYLCDFKGRFIDANNAALEMLGYTSDEIRSLKFSSLLDQGQIIKAYNVVREIKKYGYQKTIREFKLKRKNGEFIHVETMGSLIYRDGKPFAVQGIARNITDRKTSEIKLRNRTEDLELLNLINTNINNNRNLDEIIKLISYETGRIFNSFNSTIYLISEDKKSLVLKKSGLNTSDKKIISRLTGIDFSDFKVPLIKGSLYYKCINENKPILLNTKKEIIKMIGDATDNKYLRKFAPLIAKKLKINSTMLVPLISGNDCFGLIDISREIPFLNSDLSRFENIARQLSVAIDRIILKDSTKLSEEKYRSIFNNVNDEIIILNKYGRILDVNPRVVDLLGHKPEELIGEKFSKLSNLEFRKIPQFLILFRDVIYKGKTIKRMDLKVKHKNGNDIYVEVSVRPVFENGKVEKLICIVRDVTERKQAEIELKNTHKELKELNKTLEEKVKERTFEVTKLLAQKDEFVNQLGHDLKNPLNPLVNLLPLVEKREKDPKSKEMLRVINRNIDYMKNLVVKTIELARLNAPGTEFNIKEINVLDHVNSVIEKNKLLFDSNKIKIKNKIDYDLYVKADELRLEELFDNLINNSLKYSKDFGEIIIDSKENNNFVIISIKDKGMGMTKKQIAHVFEEFYKADPSRHDFDSSGLGLPICKRIVEKHGGRIWAESKGISKGTTIYFTMPLV